MAAKNKMSTNIIKVAQIFTVLLTGVMLFEIKNANLENKLDLELPSKGLENTASNKKSKISETKSLLTCQSLTPL